MNIPDIFKKTIANTFYDKDIEIWSSGTIKDEDYAVIGTGKIAMLEKFKGNFQYSTREKIKQEYGETIEANAIVTCENTVAEIGNILVYKNTDFNIKSKIQSDSHITLLVESDENV